MDTRLFPLCPVLFQDEILPLIENDYIWKGRPPQISHFQVFCAILYVLRTGIPWRDLPSCYGHWHAVYLRFKRGSEKGLWWRILYNLQRRKKIKIKVILADSTTFKVHRHGGGQKGGSVHGEGTGQA
jgi:transposase